MCHVLYIFQDSAIQAIVPIVRVAHGLLYGDTVRQHMPHRDALCSTSTAATISAIDVLLLVVVVSGGGGGGTTTGTGAGIGGGVNGGLGTISGGCVPFPLLPLLLPWRGTSHGGIGLALPTLKSSGGCSPGCARSHARLASLLCFFCLA